MEKLLTVVVPTYKVEQYIEECLDSFALEEVGDALQVLVVNDGSPDRSPEIARAYQEKYPQIFQVIDKENGGHGSTINTGLSLAQGKYFKVVDGDDWVDKKAFLHLMKVLKNSNYDLVASNYCWVDYQTGEKTPEKPPFKDVEYKRTYLFSEIGDKTFIKMHSLTYRTELLRSCNFQIDEHCYYVDAEYALFPIPRVRTVYFLKDCVYMYRMGMEGQSMNILNMQKNRKQYVRVLQRMLDYYKEKKQNGCPEANLAYMENAIGLLCISYFKILLSYPKGRRVLETMKKFDLGLKEKYPQVYEKMRHPAVRALRISGYRLYPAAQKMFELSMKKK